MGEETPDGEVICPMVEAVKHVGSAWKLVVISYLMNGGKGFNELLRTIPGLNSKTLSRTLKQLQEDGIVERKIVSLQPFSVKYILTEKGKALEPVISSLKDWSLKWVVNKKDGGKT